jgi:hypothetical protein
MDINTALAKLYMPTTTFHDIIFGWEHCWCTGIAALCVLCISSQLLVHILIYSIVFINFTVISWVEQQTTCHVYLQWLINILTYLLTPSPEKLMAALVHIAAPMQWQHGTYIHVHYYIWPQRHECHFSTSSRFSDLCQYTCVFPSLFSIAYFSSSIWF